MPQSQKPLNNKIASACDLTELLEEMHVHKHTKDKNLSEEEVIKIRKEWYLDRLKTSLGDADGVPSKRKI